MRALCVAVMALLLATAPGVEAKKKHTAIVARVRQHFAGGPAPAPMMSMPFNLPIPGRSLLQDTGAEKKREKQHPSDEVTLGSSPHTAGAPADQSAAPPADQNAAPPAEQNAAAASQSNDEGAAAPAADQNAAAAPQSNDEGAADPSADQNAPCLLYTSDAADDYS
jgi:hypothetical protein